MPFYIYPYSSYSASMKKLSNALLALVIRTDGTSKYVNKRTHTIINWGCSGIPNEEVMKSKKLLNRPSAVSTWSNKVIAFRWMRDNDIATVPWTEDPKVAADWAIEGGTVFARTSLTGHSGEGIVKMTADNVTQWPNRCRLFTKYVPKKEEYRLHFVGKKVIDVQKKSLRTTDDDGNPIDREVVDFQIRNLKNGFVYTRGNIVEVPEAVTSVCQDLINKTDLDFGAIDVIYNGTRDAAYVLEVNTAPGLTGTTLTKYVEAFNAL